MMSEAKTLFAIHKSAAIEIVCSKIDEAIAVGDDIEVIRLYRIFLQLRELAGLKDDGLSHSDPFVANSMDDLVSSYVSKYKLN